METLAAHFTYVITSLRAVIAAVAAKNHARNPLLMALWSRVGRMSQRFERLYARWQAGTLPNPRPSRAGQPRAGKPREKSPFPTKRAWLLATTRETAAAHGQLAHFLTQPGLADFLAAVPQAARILRPLCQMLGNACPMLGTRDANEPRPPRARSIRAPKLRTPKPRPPKPPRSPPPTPGASTWLVRPPPPRDYEVNWFCHPPNPIPST